jgi:RNA polymerase sigma-70 factor, ECF subfamily
MQCRVVKRVALRAILLNASGTRDRLTRNTEHARLKNLRVAKFHEKVSGTNLTRPVSKDTARGETDESYGRRVSFGWRRPVSYGEPIALREEAEIERIAAPHVAATSGDVRPTLSRIETQFIERLRTRDATAFEQLVAERSGEIYSLLVRLTEDREEARDLTQEVFLQAFRHIENFRGEANLRTWLYRIAVNEARNRRRWWMRRQRHKTVSLDAETDKANLALAERISVDNGANPEQKTLEREREQVLLKALGSLGRQYREVIVMRDIEDLSYEEVAHTLQINIGTVKSRLARARSEMRRRLEGSL